MRVSLRSRLLLACGVLALVVVLAITALQRGNAALDDATDRRADARQDLAILAQVEKDLLDLETGVRGFVITGDEQFLQPWDAARRRLPRDLSALRTRLTDSGDDRAEARTVQQASLEYLREYTQPVIAAVRAGRPQAASRATTIAGKRRVDRIRDIVRSLTEEESAQAASFSTSADQRVHEASRFGIAALAASSALIVLFTVYLLRGIVAPIRRVSAAADDLAAGDLAARAPEGGVPEFARLGVSFNRMASTIAESQTSMDARNQELDRAKHDAERANQAKSEFISRMSHELRTPLNAILGFAQLLGLDELDDDQRESVDQIERAGRHLLQLIDEVLDIARVEAGELRLSPEPVDAAELIAEALALVAPLAAQRSIRVLHAFGDGTDAHVMADRQRLKQILLNLLSNAIKYNRDGGDVRVSIDLDDPGRTTIAIADSGAGLLPEQLSKLFAPFERLGAEHGSVDGTGLGLALSRRLAEAMGGTLDVQSVARQGSTFSVRLARAAAPEPADQSEERPAVVIAGERTILYIEDNLSNLRLVERLLARYSTVTMLPAMQASIGLELAREHKPDMVLLDLHLPDLPGEEVLLRLRAEPATRDTPVVILSADASPGQIRRLREAGATAYLTKPIDLHELLQIVERCLGPAPAGAI